MFNRDPVRSRRAALQCALKHDLLATIDHAGAGRRRNNSRRPREHECDVVLFGQVWSGQALGHAEAEAAMRFEQDTTIVIGPEQDACVYAGMALVYHVIHPNRRFFLEFRTPNSCACGRGDRRAPVGSRPRIRAYSALIR